jgi:hypothetical protein
MNEEERSAYQLPPEVAEWAYSIEEMARILRLKVSTLKARCGCGTNHPPFKMWIRGVMIFPKDEFRVWAMQKPIVYEVKSAG